MFRPAGAGTGLAFHSPPTMPRCASALAVFYAILIALTGTIAAPASAQARHPAEQNVFNLPTTQPIRRFGHPFRLTHRFARDLRRGSVGQLANDLFGLDNGAIIGFDYRFAPLTNTQVGVYRSMLLKTIQMSGRIDHWRQGAALPIRP
jgi:hypothetical protein